MSLKRLWFVVGALGMVAVLVLGWFLLVRPLIEGGLQAELEARQTEASNADLEAQIAILAKEYEGIDDLRDELELMLESIPGQPDIASLIRQLDAAQAVSGARIISLSPGDATAYVPAVPQVTTPQAAAVDPAEGESGETASGDGASPTVPTGGSAGLAPAASADTLALSTAGLVLVPIDLQVSGSPGQILALVEALQRMSRLFLVVSVEAVGGEAPGGSISGFVYVLPQAKILALEPEPTATPTPTPTPTSTVSPTPSPTPSPTRTP